MTPRLLLIASAIALSACADPEERSTDWSYLHATIIEPNCATIGCHSNATQAGPTLPSLTDPDVFVEVPIDLSTPERACRAFKGPDMFGSILDDVLEGTDYGGDPPNEYPQMPPDVPLAPGEIRLIEQWIHEGLQCD